MNWIGGQERVAGRDVGGGVVVPIFVRDGEGERHGDGGAGGNV